MGYIRHDAVIVTMPGYALNGEYGVPKPDIEGFRDSLPEDWRHLVVGPVRSVVNDYWTVAFLPDGSKEDWGTSDEGDEYRRRFTDMFSFAHEDGSTPFDVVVTCVRFGGDEPNAEYEPELIVSNGRGLRIDSGMTLRGGN